MTKTSYDVVIIGSGPAGLQAAIHAARRKVSVLVLGRLHHSSAHKAHIENYCCIDGHQGAELLRQARAKAQESGANFAEEDVVELGKQDDGFVLKTETDKKIFAKAVILAMGITRNRLGVKGEKKYLGKGISYCVDCDGGFYKGEPVAVIGSGSAAVSAALTMLFYASEVYLICEKLDVSQYLFDKVKESSVKIIEGKKVREILGNDSVNGISLDDGTRLDVKGVFIELGAKGAIELAGSLGVALDPETMKYISANKKQETNIPGVYAAGDICGPPWQVAKAIGEGCVAGLEAATFAKKN